MTKVLLTIATITALLGVTACADLGIPPHKNTPETSCGGWCNP